VFFLTMVVWLVWIAVASVSLFLQTRSPVRAGEHPVAITTG
jgi:hypothetical protein